jgi:HEAT repeat protein
MGRPNVGELAAKGKVRGLIKALRHPESYIRNEAAEKLGKLGDARALEPLAAALRDSDWMVRHTAAEALGALADPRAVDPLIQALPDESAAGMAAARILVELGDARAVEPLLTRGDNTNAFKLLVKLRDRRANDVLVQGRGMIGDLESTEFFLKELADERVIPWLLTVLDQEEDPDTLADAADALAILEDPVAVEPLATAAVSLDLVKSREGAMARGKALKAIHRIFAGLERDGRAEQLLGFLDSSEQWLREYAAFTLSELGNQAAEDRLREKLGSALDEARGRGRVIAGALETISRPVSWSAEQEIRERAERFAASDRLRKYGVAVGR